MTDEQARQILADHGEQDVPPRGKLRADLKIKAQHYADQDAAQGSAGSDEAGEAAPVTDGVTVAADPPGIHAETKPRRPRTPPGGGLAGRLRKARGSGGKGKPRRPKRPRVQVDRLCGMAWEGMGRLFTPVSPPVGRTLQLQAPIAGLILEDVVRGTMVDRALQPVARNLEKGRKVYALAGPPAIVLALQAAQQLPADQRALREAFLVPMLLESLMAWDDVAGGKLDESMARQAEDGPRRERAEQMMALIFAPMAGQANGAGTSPAGEDAEAARAQQMAGAAM